MSEKEFTLKHVFEDVLDLKEDEDSDETEELLGPTEEHCGEEWNIKIDREEDHLGIYIYAEVPAGKEISLDYTIKIVSKDKKKTCSVSTSCMFKYGLQYHGCSSFIDWQVLENEYLDDGKLEVEIHVKITKMSGYEEEEIERKDLRSFGEDMKQFSDVVLKVKWSKFYVLKLYLSAHSPYFASLFLGKFQEAEKSEVELKDVDPEDFQCYLEVLYGENAIDEDTVYGILSVADMLNTPIVVKKCEEFLMEKSKKGLKRKLELAGNYRMEGLKKMCLDEIKSKEDIRSVIPADPMEMDKGILAELLKKSLDSN
ncbi:hypothetical protein B9Z55_007622 [Caenorhabditis nigoni]|uniref:BTB domain-containing protein n=1 Tax=Caenorhabditis nigoni TaxID=1611254 RepID=A0A2G5VB59_9PELO|nr:hypothetical protein B9Z55_007622 [Caenorhabditis nigoni]